VGTSAGARTAAAGCEAAGAAGVFISDQVFPNRCGYLPGKQVIPVEQMLAKVKAALDARRDPNLFIAARTDAASIEGVESAIARCQLFMEAGADMAKPMGVDTVDGIKRVLREVGGPHMATLSQAAGAKKRSLEELEAAGVVAATFPSLPLFAAAHAVRDVLRAPVGSARLPADVSRSFAIGRQPTDRFGTPQRRFVASEGRNRLASHAGRPSGRAPADRGCRAPVRRARRRVPARAGCGFRSGSPGRRRE